MKALFLGHGRSCSTARSCAWPTSVMPDGAVSWHRRHCTSVALAPCPKGAAIAERSEIDERDLARLAASPLTLRMMIDIAASDEGALPGTRAELFDRALLRLADERDAGRRRELASQALHVGRPCALPKRRGYS